MLAYKDGRRIECSWTRELAVDEILGELRNLGVGEFSEGGLESLLE